MATSFRRITFCRILSLSALALLACPLHAADTRPFTVEDLVAMERLSAPEVSPDGTKVVFVVRATDLEANRGRMDLWLADLAGGEPRQLTTHPENDSEPHFAPDGKHLYFVSTRSGSSQIWRLDLAGGEARPVTELALDVANLVVSPDGTTLAFSAEVLPDCPKLQCTADRLKEKEGTKASGQLYERLFVRHWDTWKDGRRSHLFTLPAAGGEPVDVTAGLDADVPSKPFGGAEEITFTPDGKTLVFSAREAGAGEPWSTDFNLYAVPADGSEPPRKLTSNPAWDTHPVFSPDGRTLAYLAMSQPGYESDRFRILLRGWPEGGERVLAESWDRSAQELVWSADGRTLFTTTDDLGNHSLVAIDVLTGSVRHLMERGTSGSPAVAGDQLVFLWDDLSSPAELYRVAQAGGMPRALTTFNKKRVDAVRWGESEPFTFAGWNGETVHGWVVKPVDFKPGERYPLAFLIHGGPQGSFGDHFHYRWNPQTYAGAGYATVMIDFHGSTGYGQAFTDSIGGDWGGKPLEDLQKGLAAALERYPWIDGTRACALGASYGGFMINWIAGKWPDGFRCLVNHDGIFDQRAMYYSTEELWFPEREFGGPAWQNPEHYETWSPSRFVASWKTPMFVIHGALDYRVPETQGLSTFTALQRRSIPSQLLVFPNENHWVLKPQNSIQWHHAVKAWLDRWIGPEAPR